MMGLEIRHWCCRWHRDREIFWGKYKTLAAAGRRDTDLMFGSGWRKNFVCA